MAARRRRCPEVPEVERQDREIETFGERHDGAIDESEIEAREPDVELDGPPQQSVREVCDRVLAPDEGDEKRPGGGGGDPGAQEMVHLRGNRRRHEEIAREAGDERRSKRMRRVAAIVRGDERPRIRDRLQRSENSSRRYSSALIARSPGPSPAPT